MEKSYIDIVTPVRTESRYLTFCATTILIIMVITKFTIITLETYAVIIVIFMCEILLKSLSTEYELYKNGFDSVIFRDMKKEEIDKSD